MFMKIYIYIFAMHIRCSQWLVVFRVDVIFPAITIQACAPRKTKTRGTISPSTAQFCYIGSGIGWVIFSMEAREGRYTMIGVTCFPLNDRILILLGKNNTQKKKEAANMAEGINGIRAMGYISR